jgi:hypothetical protein
VCFVVISVTVYVGQCRYFIVVRILNSVVCGYRCYCICWTMQVLQCSEDTEQCGLWLLVLLYMLENAGTSV